MKFGFYGEWYYSPIYMDYRKSLVKYQGSFIMQKKINKGAKKFMSSIYLNGVRYGGGGKTFQYSETKPTEVSEVGKIVLNSLPNPNEYIGWVYTPLGWFGFGKIESLENEENAFITADDYKIQTVDGDVFCYKTT